MTEKIAHVKNPLTIIAIFAGLAEVGGTIVLPLLQESTQAVYVWFLMIFPTFLVGVFFLVLYKKHHVLYAPSDYRDDSTFEKILQSSIPAASLKKVEASNRALEQASVSPAPASELAAAQQPEFTALSVHSRKVLKTLWKFQQEAFPNDASKRWGVCSRVCRA